MPQRTTTEAVQGLLTPGGDYDLVNMPSLQPFIDTAWPLVDQCVVFAGWKGYTLSNAQQEIIERWLSAHFYQQSDQGLSSKSTAGASGSFQGQTTMGFENSKYGQTALRSDWTGSLNAIDKRLFARGFSQGRADWNRGCMG